MYKLLRLDASARGDRSISRALADAFETAWLDRLPGGQLMTRDLVATPVPHLPAEIVPRAEGLQVDGHAARFQDALVDELLTADAVLISTPMYNLGIPSVLKAWIDHVVLAGRTLTFHGEPPTAGIPATVVTAYGGGYGPGAPREGWDHLKPYLDAVLGGILGMDVEFVGVELTLAATTPAMEGLVELAERSLAAGHAAAAEQGAAVAARLLSGRPAQIPQAS